MSQGIVYLVGAGPGEPDLITVRGAQLISRAEALVYDYLAHPDLKRLAPRDCEMIYVGKKAGAHSMQQEDINALIIDLAQSGKRVVRLKGGDPFVFGRGGEECLALREAGIPFEVIPGVTAGVAAPMFAGIPVTHRALATTVTFITGHERAEATEDTLPYNALANTGGSLVFYMGVGNLQIIANRLMEEGLPAETPAAVIRWGAHPRQQTIKSVLERIAEDVAQAQLRPPAIIIIGQVAQLREHLNWFETRPLFGRRILVTRSRTQSSSLLQTLREQGAEGIEFPTIAIAPTDEPEKLRQAASRSGEYDWIIFSSVNAVEHFMQSLTDDGADVRAMGAARLAAIGPVTTQALQARGLRVDATPERFVAEDLVKAIREFGDLQGAKILVPRSNIGRLTLIEGLTEAGAQVDQVNAYKTIAQEPENFAQILEQMKAGQIDAVTFASSSTVDNFINLIGKEAFVKITRQTTLASIGPITSKTIRSHGAEPAIEAGQYTIDGLVQALMDYFRK